MSTRVYAPRTPISYPMSPKQHDYLADLLRTKDTTGIVAPDLDTFSSAEARDLISILVARPYKADEKVVYPSAEAVPAGRYAVLVPDDSQLGFFVVDRPTEGKWAGRVFVRQMASDNEFPVRGSRRGVVLNLIADDYHAAGALFGQRIGRCCRCNRTLTDEASRAAGIGPDCAGKF